MVLQASSENLPSIADQAGYLLDVPSGTVLPVPGDPLSFDVKGSERNGSWWYRVFVGDETHCPRCECRFHQKKLRGTRRPCRHLKAVLYCPACQGSGVRYAPVINILTDKSRLEAWPCVECLGQGSREAYLDVQALKREWDQRHAEDS